jgi:hypothetical protein
MKRPRWLPSLRRGRNACPECGAAVPETQCEVCGYDLLRETREHVALDAMHRRPV